MLLASQQLLILATPSDHPPVTVVLTGFPVDLAIWTGVMESAQLTGRVVAIVIPPRLNRKILVDLPQETVVLKGFPVDLAIWTGSMESTKLTGIIVAIAILLQLNRKILSFLPPEIVVLKGCPVDLAISIKARGYSHHPDRKEITNNG